MLKAKIAGFTLIELVATVSIAALVLILGLPSFQDMIRANRMAAHSNRFLGALNLARSEAIKRGQMVFLCKADTEAAQPACDSAPCSGGGCWEKGWLVLADANVPPNNLPDDADTLIRVFEPLPKTLTLRVGSHDADWVAFNSVGTGKGSGAGGQVDDTFNLCQGDNAAQGRAIVLNSLGRARVRAGATACP